MYFYLAMVGFEPTPTATAAPSNTETTVIPSRPLHLYIFRCTRIRNDPWPEYLLELVYLFFNILFPGFGIHKIQVFLVYIDDCVSTTKPSNPIRRVMQRNQA